MNKMCRADLEHTETASIYYNMFIMKELIHCCITLVITTIINFLLSVFNRTAVSNTHIINTQSVCRH